MLNEQELAIARQVLDIVGGAEGYLKEAEKEGYATFCHHYTDFSDLWGRTEFSNPLKKLAERFVSSTNTYATVARIYLFSMKYSDYRENIGIRYKFLKWLEQQV